MLNEKCAVFGVYGKNIEAGRLTYFGLYALQHRGQEGSGIASTDGALIHHHRKPGLVAQVYNEKAISKLKGHAAIGHNRYSTSGGNSYTHLQPIVIGDIAVAHNGNLPSVTALVEFLKPKGIKTKGCTDSELMAEAIAWYIAEGNSVEDAVTKAYPLFTGAFALLIMTPDKLIGLRDTKGIRPLCLGKLDGGYILSSETCALDTVHAKFVREIQAGEMVVIDKKGICCEIIAKAEENLDIFEFIYFSRPDSTLMGKSVDAVRRNFGVELARETPKNRVFLTTRRSLKIATLAEPLLSQNSIYATLP
jgi:amidophosphoribosyltransferase